MTQNTSSPYFFDENEIAEKATYHTLFMIADNEPGVLARVTSLFSARGYGIQSLTAGEIDEARHLSCMTITTFGTPQVIAQIKAQLEKIIAIRSVVNLSIAPNAVMREMILVRIMRSETNLQTLRDRLDLFGARQIDSEINTITFELNGETIAIDQYIEQLRVLCRDPAALSIARSGIAGLAD